VRPKKEILVKRICNATAKLIPLESSCTFFEIEVQGLKAGFCETAGQTFHDPPR
jgi:hypothetical protein